jgi:hypothetical protein
MTEPANKQKMRAKETYAALLRAKEIYEYRDGALYWKEKVSKKVIVGSRAGCLNPVNGYRDARIDGLRFKEHRVIWAILTGTWPKHEIDHINHDKSDNRIENLRDVEPSVNQRSKPICANNTSGCKGISWRAHKNKWQAYTTINGVFKSLGHFASLEDAIVCRAAFMGSAV